MVSEHPRDISRRFLGYEYSAYLSQLLRADEGTRTADLPSYE